LTDGQLSAAFRAVDESRSRYIDGVMIQPWHPFTTASMLPVNPGEAMLLPVEVFHAAALIRAGHRLSISISSSNQAQGGWSRAAQPQATGGVSTIYNDVDHPSSIVLPVVPASVLQ
jgi:predicted acyl esterase